jgi:hypothetical protein
MPKKSKSIPCSNLALFNLLNDRLKIPVDHFVTRFLSPFHRRLLSIGCPSSQFHPVRHVVGETRERRRIVEHSRFVAMAMSFPFLSDGGHNLKMFTRCSSSAAPLTYSRIIFGHVADAVTKGRTRGVDLGGEAHQVHPPTCTVC